MSPFELCQLTAVDGSCYKSGNPSGLRHLLYAGKPVHRNGLPPNALPPLCLGNQPSTYQSQLRGREASCTPS
ncbi:hypothetical protein [Calothrix rhizosoleniae]|uniref:hypothetical protein n=1 Tax=Calothrix rhizosoleniae TaxID=888997 RepID=UPI0011787A65|nr:hypothetical protein [Calothrix rhizosoleniae]